jgi:TatD DNase family protein
VYNLLSSTQDASMSAAAAAPPSASTSSSSLPACPRWLLDAPAHRDGPLIDAHVHLADSTAFLAADMPALLQQAAAHGVGRIVAVPEDTEQAARCLELSRTFPSTVAAGAGVHPVRWSLLAGGAVARAAELTALTAFIEQHHASLVCVGECGLDFSPWILQQAAAITSATSNQAASANSSDNAASDDAAPGAASAGPASWKQAKESPADAAERAAQVDLFRAQVRLAVRFGLPLNVHSRNASKHAVALLREEGIGIGGGGGSDAPAGRTAATAVTVLLHAFDGSLSTVREALKLRGVYFSATTSLCRDAHAQSLFVQLLTESPLVQAPPSLPLQDESQLPENAAASAAQNSPSPSASSSNCCWIPSVLLRMVLESDSPALHPIKQPPPSASAVSVSASAASVAASAASSSASTPCCVAENNTPSNLFVALMTLHDLYGRARTTRLAAEQAAAERKRAATNRPARKGGAAGSKQAREVAVAPVASSAAAVAAPVSVCADMSMEQLAVILRLNTLTLFPRLARME